MYSLIARSIGCKEEQLMMGLTVSRYLQVEGSCSEMLRDTPSTHLGSAAVQTCNTQPAPAMHQISGTTSHLYTLHMYVQQEHSVVMQKCSCHKDNSLHSQLHISVFACYITPFTFCIIVHNYPTEKGNKVDIYNNVHNFTTT